MQVIFGEKQKNMLGDKFTFLELDTFIEKGLNSPVTVYAVLGFSDVPLTDLPSLERFSRMHEAMLTEYKKRNWDFCLQALEHLMGQWGKQIDSFYEIFQARIKEYAEKGVPDDWSPIVVKG